MEDKKEEEKKEEPKAEEPKKTEEKKPEAKKEESDSNTLSEKERASFLKQLEKLEEENKRPAHKKSEIKDKYDFWETQPVPQFDKDCEVKFGEIWKDHKKEDLPKKPFDLPEEGLEWQDVDMTQQNQIDKLYEFLKTNYVED